MIDDGQALEQVVHVLPAKGQAGGFSGNRPPPPKVANAVFVQGHMNNG
jgi:hypothetical protein